MSVDGQEFGPCEPFPVNGKTRWAGILCGNGQGKLSWPALTPLSSHLLSARMWNYMVGENAKVPNKTVHESQQVAEGRWFKDKTFSFALRHSLSLTLKYHHPSECFFSGLGDFTFEWQAHCSVWKLI